MLQSDSGLPHASEQDGVSKWPHGPSTADRRRRSMKVAIIHDWLVVRGGAEQVLAEMLAMFPEADLYTTVCFLPSDQREFLQGRSPRTTFIQRLPRAASKYRSYFPLMPLAIEQFDFSAYDVVISSSYCAAKGIITGPNQVHISYVHSSARWAWDMQAGYLKQVGLERGLKSVIARLMLHYFRLWDTRTAHGVDHYVANSRFVAARIRKTYGRNAAVVHPPVDVAQFAFADKKEDFYLTASRLVPYKRIPLIVEAFAAMPTKRLVVIGDGPDMAAVRALGAPNVTVLGYQSTEVLVDHMQRAKAFLFAAEEDFGIVPLEAQACGTPVIAYGRGGALETVIGDESAGEERTGVFFFEQTSQAIASAVEEFETAAADISAAACRKNAMRFTREQFRKRLQTEIDAAMATYDQDLATARRRPSGAITEVDPRSNPLEIGQDPRRRTPGGRQAPDDRGGGLAAVVPQPAEG